MASILLQAGHSAHYSPFIPNGGGAPGEADWTGRFCNELERRLANRGIVTAVVGSWLSGSVTYSPPFQAKVRYDLAIMCHYDADIYHVGGGFIDRYRPEEYNRAPTGQLPIEEDFMALFDAIYFPALGILNMPNRRNANTEDYYAYRAMNKNTPRVLIEFGIGAPGAPDSYTLWHDMSLVVDTLFSVIEENLIQRGLLSPDAPEPEEPLVSEFAEPLSREVAISRLQQLGYLLPEGFAITERAISSTRVNGGAEWRGPAMSDEYPFTHPDGTVTTRRDFTGGSVDYDSHTQTANWAEVVKESRQ